MNGSPTQNHMLLNVDRSVAEIQHNIHRVSDLIHSTGASVNEVSTPSGSLRQRTAKLLPRRPSPSHAASLQELQRKEQELAHASLIQFANSAVRRKNNHEQRIRRPQICSAARGRKGP